eukprot:m.100420 g.100420  ORF g.100420 m.100420 type:complete len:256 (+) comp15123_c0_seq2:1201-1968(+)
MAAPRHQLALWTAFSTKIDELMIVNKSTAGRDKLYRVVQYFCRFLAWALKSPVGNSSELYTKVAALQAHLSTARKLMRLFRSIEHLKTAQLKYLSLQNAFLKLSITVDFVNKALRMVFDHLQWAGTVGLLGPNGRTLSHTLGRRASVFWLLGLLASLCSTVYQLEGVTLEQKRMAASGRTAAAGELKNRRQALLEGALRDMLDLPVPAHALGMLPQWTDGMVGLGGSLSSLIGLVQVWKAVMSKHKQGAAADVED